MAEHQQASLPGHCPPDKAEHIRTFVFQSNHSSSNERDRSVTLGLKGCLLATAVTRVLSDRFFSVLGAMALQSRTFEISYHNSEAYPTNLIWKPSSDFTLETIRNKLDRFDSAQITPNNAPYSLRVLCRDGEANVPYTDIRTRVSQNGAMEHEPLHRSAILDDTKLRELLGDQDAVGQIPPIRLTKIDPQCRLMKAPFPSHVKQCGLIIARFLAPNGNSREPLKISKTMLRRLLSYHQVMPAYVEFLSVFGQQDRSRDMHFASFREEKSLSQRVQNLNRPTSGRSGRGYQMCYNLKTVGIDETKLEAMKNDSEGVTYISKDRTFDARVFRQVAVHHQFDVEKGTAVWIFTHGRWDLARQISKLNTQIGVREDMNFLSLKSCLNTTLSYHLLLSEWTANGWQDYLDELEDAVVRAVSKPPAPLQDQYSSLAQTSDSVSSTKMKYTPANLMEIQILEEKANSFETQLGGNVRTLKLLRRFYVQLLSDPNFPLRVECKKPIKAFADTLNEKIGDIELQISSARLLRQTASNRKALVTQHLQAQATSRMETLSVGMYRETVAMRVLAIITLIYLPATFVSSFFSTDVIKFQQSNQGYSLNLTTQDGTSTQASKPFKGSFSAIALQRWLEVTLPLMFLTCVAAFSIYLHANHSWKKRTRGTGLVSV